MHRHPSPLATWAVVLVGAAALLLTGCSKDDPVAVPPSGTASPTTQAAGAGAGSTSTTASPEVRAFCVKFTNFGQQATSLSDGDPNTLSTAKSYFQQLEDAAPADIKADLAAWNTWVQSLSSIQDPPDELKTSGARIGSWARQHCVS